MTAQATSARCNTLTIRLEGQTHALDHQPGETVAQAAFRHGLTPPVSCLSGMCGTCIARLLHGSADMLVNAVLTAEDMAQGLILTCQAIPTTCEVSLVYED